MQTFSFITGYWLKLTGINLFHFKQLALIQTNVIVEELKKFCSDTSFEIGKYYLLAIMHYWLLLPRS